jgi:hypothetical protein
MTGLRMDIVLGHIKLGTPTEHAVSIARNLNDKNAIAIILKNLASAQAARHVEEKLPTLLAHYDIAEQPDGSHWKRLAYALAAAHEPGFKFVRTKLATGQVNDAEIGIRWELLKRQIRGHKVTEATFAAAYPDMKSRKGTGTRMAFQRWARTPEGKRLSKAPEADLRLIVEFFSQ